jgi:hypothetical protein
MFANLPLGLHDMCRSALEGRLALFGCDCD